MKYLSLERTVSGGVRTQVRSRELHGLKRLEAATEQFWLSRWYFPAMLLLAAMFVAADCHVIGTAVMLCVGAWFLALCPDFMACVCPLVLVCVLVGPKYQDLSVFIPCLPLAVPLVCALMLHLMRWPVTIRAGRSAKGLVLVSVATLLGGCDVMRREEYWCPLSLYYTLGLGVGLLLLYLLFRSEIAREHSYDLGERFAAILYTAGVLMALVVFVYYVWRWDHFLELGHLLYLKFRNYAATMLLVALPATFFFALRSRWHLTGTAVMALAMAFSGSRSALLFGAVELLLGCAYLVYYGAVSRKTMLLVLALGGVVMALCGAKLLLALYANRIGDGQFIDGDEKRWTLLACGVRDFLRHPVFGMGLGNTANRALTATNVAGSMFFYHNMVMQVLGSMGLLGVVAYGQLILDRVTLLVSGRSAFTTALGLSYLGMVMMSMTNPGEFCPFPNAALMVMLFAVAEDAVGDVALPVRQLLGVRRYAHRSHRPAYAHKYAHK